MRWRENAQRTAEAMPVTTRLWLAMNSLGAVVCLGLFVVAAVKGGSWSFLGLMLVVGGICAVAGYLQWVGLKKP